MKNSIYTQKHEALVECLVEARKSASMTQQTVADALGKPQFFVAKYENGERRLDVIELMEIATILSADFHAMVDRVADVHHHREADHPG